MIILKITVAVAWAGISRTQVGTRSIVVIILAVAAIIWRSFLQAGHRSIVVIILAVAAIIWQKSPWQAGHRSIIIIIIIIFIFVFILIITTMVIFITISFIIVNIFVVCVIIVIIIFIFIIFIVKNINTFIFLATDCRTAFFTEFTRRTSRITACNSFGFFIFSNT